jgi:L-aminopeptidase/D-esterase-like protein
MSDTPRLPDGFRVGHWTDREAETGCTVVVTPPGTRGSVDVRGGGTGTRELEALSPLANAEGPTAVLLAGGSAFGLAAADGVARWLEERGLGRPTPAGPVPLVAAAVVFDLVQGDQSRRPGLEEGYAACRQAVEGAPERGRVGAGAGTAVGKLLGRQRASRSGVGCAATLAAGVTVSAIAVANAFGDVIAADGTLLGAPRDERGELRATAELIGGFPDPPDFSPPAGASTTLVCVCTDAALDKRGCAILARIASAGVARAVNPAFTPVDGDVIFCLASGPMPAPSPGPAATWSLTRLGTLAASVTSAAIRDGVVTAGDERPTI